MPGTLPSLEGQSLESACCCSCGDQSSESAKNFRLCRWCMLPLRFERRSQRSKLRIVLKPADWLLTENVGEILSKGEKQPNHPPFSLPSRLFWRTIRTTDGQPRQQGIFLFQGVVPMETALRKTKVIDLTGDTGCNPMKATCCSSLELKYGWPLVKQAFSPCRLHNEREAKDWQRMERNSQCKRLGLGHQPVGAKRRWCFWIKLTIFHL